MLILISTKRNVCDRDQHAYNFHAVYIYCRNRAKSRMTYGITNIIAVSDAILSHPGGIPLTPCTRTCSLRPLI